jgi:hypothetical protein
MKKRAEIAALKRQQLIAESAARRANLALQAQPVMRSLESAKVALRIAGRVGRHPAWIAAAAIGLVLVTPRRLSALLLAGTGGLRGWRMIAPAVQMLLARR